MWFIYIYLENQVMCSPESLRLTGIALQTRLERYVHVNPFKYAPKTFGPYGFEAVAKSQRLYEKSINPHIELADHPYRHNFTSDHPHYRIDLDHGKVAIDQNAIFDLVDNYELQMIANPSGQICETATHIDTCHMNQSVQEQFAISMIESNHTQIEDDEPPKKRKSKNDKDKDKDDKKRKKDKNKNKSMNKKTTKKKKKDKHKKKQALKIQKIKDMDIDEIFGAGLYYVDYVLYII